MPGWYVYILRCGDDTLYTGVTTDPERRVDEHNSNASITRYTRARQPVELIYQEPVADRASACRRESEIKRLNRRQKLSLVGGDVFSSHENC